MSQEEGTQQFARPQVRISECKAMLREGKTRKEIAEHYGVPMSVMAEKVWSLPELKGLKTRKIFDIEVINDMQAASEAVEAVTNMVATDGAEEITESLLPALENVTIDSNTAFGDMQGDLAPQTSTIDEWSPQI